MRARVIAVVAAAAYTGTPVRGQVEDRPERLAVSADAAARRAGEARTLFGLGTLAARTGLLLRATALLESASLLDPGAAEIDRELVPLYISLDRPWDARAACARVLAADGQDFETRYLRALVSAADRDWAAAAADTRDALTSDRLDAVPERQFALRNALTRFREMAGDWSGAADSQRAANELLAKSGRRLAESGALSTDRVAELRAEGFENTGRLLRIGGRYADARDYYKQARDAYLELANERDRVGAFRYARNMSDLSAAEGESERALEWIDEYLSYRPRDAIPFAQRAKLLRRLNRAAEILPMLEHAVGGPNPPPGIEILYARELARWPGREGEAERLFEKLVGAAATPEPIREFVEMCRECGRPQWIVESHDRLSRLAYPLAEDRYSPERAAAQRVLHLFALVLHQVSDAGSMVQASVAGSEGLHPATALTFGTLTREARRSPDIEILLSNALKVKYPAHLKALEDDIRTALVDHYLNQRRWEEAVSQSAQRAGGPFDALLAWRRAEAENHLGRYDDALATIDRLVIDGPPERKAAALAFRGEVLARAGRGAEAREQFETLLKMPLGALDYDRVLDRCAAALESLGDLDGAERRLRQRRERSPNDPDASARLAGLLANKGKELDEAERLARFAAARKPAGAECLDALAWALYKRGKLAEAKRVQSKAVAAADYPTAEMWDHLGDILAALREDPSEAYRTAAEIYESDAWANRCGKSNGVRAKLK